METAGAKQTSELVLEGFTMMNQRWMKRRIERSRARCEAAEKRGTTRSENAQPRLDKLPCQFSRVVEHESFELGLEAKVQ